MIATVVIRRRVRYSGSRRWSAADDEALARLYRAKDKMSAAKIAETLGRTVRAVCSRASMLKLAPPGASEWTEERRSQLRTLHAQGKNLKQIAATLEHDYSSVRRRVVREGLRVKKREHPNRDWSEEALKTFAQRFQTLRAKHGANAPLAPVVRELQKLFYPDIKFGSVLCRVYKHKLAGPHAKPFDVAEHARAIRYERWSKSDTETLKRMVAENASSPEIAAALNRSVGTVERKRADLRDLEFGKTGGEDLLTTRWSESDDERLLKMAAAETTLLKMSEALRRSEPAVRARLRTLQDRAAAAVDPAAPRSSLPQSTSAEMQ